MTRVLELGAVQAILARVSYRRGQGWRFDADQADGRVRVRLGAAVEDARGPGTTDLDVHTWPPADALADEPALVRWLLGRMIEHEVHEAREWLCLDGELVDDPHGPDG